MEHKDKVGLRVLRTEDLRNEQWLRFRRKHFIDRCGEERQWDYVERTALGQGAAVVVARTRTAGRLILIRQFRIPVEAWVYEFPAGLVDPGEGVESTAHRELAEETGYSGRILSVGPAMPTTPGLSDETVSIVTMEAADEPEAHEHESSEAIEVLTLELAPGPVRALVAKAAAEGAMVDSKLYTYLLHWL
jgi:8-oxo-dGTP pyrophosphatase MutT (NUDIX family)